MSTRISHRPFFTQLWTVLSITTLCIVLVLALLWALSAPTRAAEFDEGQVSASLPPASDSLSPDATTVQSQLDQPDTDASSPHDIESINDGTADLILTGSQTDERFGTHGMDSAGDVNGDGYVDIIVGSYRYNAFDGIAYIFYGSASGVVATPAVSLTIGQAAARFGDRVAGIGDVNGDGYPDVAVGAAHYDAPTNNEGAVFVYYGSASGITNTPSITLTGMATTTYLGQGVARAGDVNGDGYDDLIAAAPGYDNGEENEGAAFVYHGSATGLNATPAITLENNITGTVLRAVAGAGDVNGDGYADVIIGSYAYNSNDGIAYVYHGSATGVSATPAVTLTSAQAGDQFAGSLDGAGDVNGDGYADVVIGAQIYDNGEVDEGASFVYHGSAAGISATPAITVESDLAYAYLGNAVAGVGDTDGDGYADILVGARIYDLPYNDAGAAFLYHGAAGGIDAANPVWLSGVSGLQYGYNVARAGDVNADGYADIMVAQDYYHTPFWRAGAVYIYHGGGSNLQSTPAWTATGAGTADSVGLAAPAGDVNGDGFSDVVIGAPWYMTNTGQVTLYLGGTDGLPSTAALTLTGEMEGDNFTMAAGAGDVNGDGYDDVLVGARGYMTGTGRAYLYLGSAGGLNPTPALTLTGENEGDCFGNVAAPAGDVNGDGYADVVIAAYSYPGGGAQGKIYLYHGSAAGLSATPAFTATGTGGERLGISLGTAGDVNGDGYADVVVGANMYDSGRGGVYVYHGSAAGLSATPAFTATGEGGNDRFGCAVGTAGDVNGDGYADIVVGAEYYTIGWQEGRAYVYLGGPGGLDTTPVFVATGENSMSYFGRAVGTAGDVNGDGYADIVIGALGYPSNQRRGKVYVYFGGEGGPDTTPDFTVTGEANGDKFGHSVATAGDVNGDGFSDLIVGARAYSGDRNKVYLYTNGGGRQVLARQLRGDGSGTPVQPWGLSHAPDGFLAQMNAINPLGRGYVKLQVEACPPGAPFGDASCVDHVTPGWTDVTTNPIGIVFTETLSGLSGDTVYRWQARVLHDSPFYPHSPWRRYLASWLEADLRVGTPPDVAIQKTVTPDIVGPGQAVTYTLAFSNAGSLAATDVTIVDQVPVTLTNITYQSSRPVTPTGAFSYTWQVGDLGTGEGGVITITAIVSPSISGVFSMTNQATIAATAADGDLGNNTSTASNTVDADPPEIQEVSPSDEAEDVGLTAPVVITFSEAIDAGTFAYTITPDPGGWMEAWNGDDTVITLTHDDFAGGRVYTVTLTAADDPAGNPAINLPYEWQFTTIRHYIYLPLVLRQFP